MNNEDILNIIYKTTNGKILSNLLNKLDIYSLSKKDIGNLNLYLKNIDWNEKDFLELLLSIIITGALAVGIGFIIYNLGLIYAINKIMAIILGIVGGSSILTIFKPLKKKLNEIINPSKYKFEIDLKINFLDNYFSILKLKEGALKNNELNLLINNILNKIKELDEYDILFFQKWLLEIIKEYLEKLKMLNDLDIKEVNKEFEDRLVYLLNNIELQQLDKSNNIDKINIIINNLNDIINSSDIYNCFLEFLNGKLLSTMYYFEEVYEKQVLNIVADYFLIYINKLVSMGYDFRNLIYLIDYHYYYNIMIKLEKETGTSMPKKNLMDLNIKDRNDIICNHINELLEIYLKQNTLESKTNYLFRHAN